MPNDSPLTGQEGAKLTSQLIRQRIYNPTQRRLDDSTSESLELRGRGVLETSRRERYELGISSPKGAILRDRDPSTGGGKLERRTVLVK